MAFVGSIAAAVAGCGSSSPASTSLGASNSGAVVLAVVAPADGSVINADNVPVRGTVSPRNATVQIQGQPAAVGNGVFNGSARLHAGKTTIDIIGSAPGATPGTTTITITRQASSTPTPARTSTVVIQTSPSKSTSNAASPSTTATGTWPAATSAWTVVLGSVSTRAEAQTIASRATAIGLTDAGILLSTEHSSLRTGYWVAYSGVLSHNQAVANQARARSLGFSDAYARFVSSS